MKRGLFLLKGIAFVPVLLASPALGACQRHPGRRSTSREHRQHNFSINKPLQHPKPLRVPPPLG